MGKRVAVVLSGCGVMDGSEIHEATIALLCLARSGAEAVCFAPDIPQSDVVNHLCNEPQTGEKRRVLVESARIARGEVAALAELDVDAVDAIVLPGGFGAAKNLCNFASEGADCDVNPDVARVLRAMHQAGKPIGVMCIAPAPAAKVLGAMETDSPVKLTIGNDADTSDALRAMGVEHVDCAVDDIVVDSANRVVSTPAYMLADNLAEVEAGVSKLIDAVLEMCGQ